MTARASMPLGDRSPLGARSAWSPLGDRSLRLWSGWRTNERPGGSNWAGSRASFVIWSGYRTTGRWNGSSRPGSGFSFVRWSGRRTGDPEMEVTQ